MRWYADRLPERERQALELRCVEERSFEETAEIMALKASSLTSALKRGVGNIRNYANRESQGLPARRTKRRGGSTS